MSTGARTPVLVGVAAVTQRESDPSRALEPARLMARALERAAEDAGSRAWLERADAIAVPRGFWDYPDPARLLAEWVGAKNARTQLAEIGVLQTTLFARACQSIRDGRAEVVLVAGGEAKYRSQQAQRAGVEAPLTPQSGAEPDETWRPAADILHAAELSAHLGSPVRQYAVMENALGSALGLGVDAMRDQVAGLWSAMSRVAVENPDAWNREEVSARNIRDAGEGNRLLAFPYTKRHTSQWNVDQAAGFVFTSVEAARAAGVPEERWIYPLAVAESNHMLPLVQRAELHRCPAFGIAGRAALEAADVSIADVEHLELYSCFPVAVRVQQRELEIPLDRCPSVTGGMAFAGGPLNNFVLQAAARMAARLRGGKDGHGLLTAVSGMLTKQGVSLWSRRPGPGFEALDVSERAERETSRIEVAEDFQGTARVSGYTVLFEGDDPNLCVVLADTEGGTRAVAVGDDAALVAAGLGPGLVGRTVEIRDGGVRLLS